MSKEIILKYLTEFNAWVKGQEVYVMFNNGGHRLVDSLEDFDEDVKYIVLKDSYFPYRTALAEGKIVEANYNKWVFPKIPTKRWDIMAGEDFDRYGIDDLRIKPEEPEFKVGDWITVNGPAWAFIECISGINDDTYVLSGTNICYKSQATKWEPKEGDLCVVWDNDDIACAVIIKFDYIDASGKYSCSHTWWDNCMPFTGVLPPHMKDN